MVTFVFQPKPSIVVFDDRAGRLQLENVGLMPTIKGEAPSITVVTLVSQPKPSIVGFDDRAGKLKSEIVGLIATYKIRGRPLVSQWRHWFPSPNLL